MQRYVDKMQQITRGLQEISQKADKRKEEVVIVYKRIVVEFEEWLVKVLQRLESGEVLTTDILVFEESLTVSIP